MGLKWSKYEIAISFHRFNDVEHLDIDQVMLQMGLKLSMYPNEIVPNRIRLLYFELFYQIEKYQYLHDVLDYDHYVENEREKHIK